jgi:hypothetical protein
LTEGEKLKKADLSSDYIHERNRVNIMSWFPKWFESLRLNGPWITELFEKRGDLNLGEIVKDHDGRIRSQLYAKPAFARNTENVLVLGSGPSANRAIPFLKDWEGVLIAGQSNASLCMAAGRPPDYILAVDGAPEVAMQMLWAPYGEAGCTLVTSPTVSPLMKLYYGGKIAFYKSYLPYQNEPYNAFLDQLYPMIRTYFLQGGCTVNQQLIVSHFLPGCKRIFLLGVDLCYPKDPQTGRFVGRGKQFKYVDGSYVELPTSAPMTRSSFVDDEGLRTDVSMRAYKRSLMTIMVMSTFPLYDCSEGIIRELPKYDIEQVIASQGSCARPFKPGEIEQIFNQYMESIGCGGTGQLRVGAPDASDHRGFIPHVDGVRAEAFREGESGPTQEPVADPKQLRWVPGPGPGAERPAAVPEAGGGSEPTPFKIDQLDRESVRSVLERGGPDSPQAEPDRPADPKDQP